MKRSLAGDELLTGHVPASWRAHKTATIPGTGYDARDRGRRGRLSIPLRPGPTADGTGPGRRPRRRAAEMSLLRSAESADWHPRQQTTALRAAPSRCWAGSELRASPVPLSHAPNSPLGAVRSDRGAWRGAVPTVTLICTSGQGARQAWATTGTGQHGSGFNRPGVSRRGQSCRRP